MIAGILSAIWNFTQEKIKWILIIAAILLVVALIGAPKVNVSNAYDDSLQKSSQAYKDLNALNENFSSASLIVVIEGKSTADIVSDKNLAAMQYIDDHFANMENVISITTPAFYLTIAKYQAGDVNPNRPTEQFIIGPDGKVGASQAGAWLNPTNAMINMTLKGGIGPDEKHDFIVEMKDVMKQAGFDQNVKTYLTGSPTVNDNVIENVSKTINRIMPIGVLGMMVIVAVLLKTRGRFVWRWLALSVVGLALLYTMGVMGYTGLKITSVSVAVFPILLGLGVDYAIQFFNRYDEENRKGLSAAQSVASTLEHIGPALVISVLVASAAFASVFFARTPMIQGFGKMLIMGVAFCLIVSVMIMLPILYLRDRKNDATNKPEVQKDSSFDKMASAVAHTSVKFIPIILVAAIALAVFGWTQDSNLEGDVGYESYLTSDNPVRINIEKVTTLMGGSTPADIVVKADNVLDPKVMQYMLDHQAILMRDSRANDPNNPGHYTGMAASIGNVYMGFLGKLPNSAAQAEDILKQMPDKLWLNFVSPDHKQAHIVVMGSSAEAEPYAILYDDMRAAFADPPEGIQVVMTGDGVLVPELAKDLDDSRTRLTYIGLGLVFAMLLLCFKFKIGRVITATLPVVVILGWSTAIMVAKDMEVTTMLALMPAQVMGIGVEFTVLLLMRYYEEREKGGIPMDSMITAMSRIGRAIVVSGLMVMVGFGSLYFAKDYPFMSDYGFVTVCDMALVLISTLVILPGVVIKYDTWRDGKNKVAEPVKK